MHRMSRKSLLLALCVYFAAATLIGCAGGGNGSSSAPLNLGGGTGSTLGSSAPDVTMKMAQGGEIKFSHDDHVTKYNQRCDACHTNDTPFPMMSKAQGKTMAQLYAGESCGKCHRAKANGGTAFDSNDGNRCQACHTANKSHEKVSPVVSREACRVCHSGTVAEYETLTPSTGTGNAPLGHGRDFIQVRGSWSSGCAECHYHSSMDGRVASFTNAATPAITCQTCHDYTANTPKRLRKQGYDLCATCHHTRYVYGDTSSTAKSYPDYNAAPNADAAIAFMPTVYLKNQVTANAKTMLTHAKVNETYTAFTTTVMGRYPHYSSQIDALKGPQSPAWMIFTHDVAGTALTTRDSFTYASYNACVECHVVTAYGGTTTNTGHSFVATNASTARKYPGWNEATVAANKTTFETAKNKLKKALDVDGDGTPKWFVRAPQSDYTAARAEVTAGRLTEGEFLVLLGAAWNFDMLYADRSRGMHNYNFLLDIANHSYTVITQVLAGKVGLPATWVTQ